MYPKSEDIRSEIEYMWATRELEYLLYVYWVEDEESLVREIAHMEKTWDYYSSPWWLDNNGE